MKKVSVIIPCYKAKDEWLERLFFSMENQTIGMEALEIIFVIDASPDDTFSRLKKYEQAYENSVMLVQCQEKVGPGGARSIGIQYATGEYIAFVDQDDWVEPCMYEHLYDKAKTYKCDVVEAYNMRDSLYEYNKGEPQKTGQQDVFWNLESPAGRKKFFLEDKPERRRYWAKLYCREFLLENHIDFPANIKYDDNYFKGLVFYHAKRVYVLEEYLYHWMVNADSISMTNDFSAHLDRMKIELLKLEEYRQRGLFTVYHDEIEYIFLEQFFANTVNTIFTRSGVLSLEVLDFMKNETKKNFPEYLCNPYLQVRCPVWVMGDWVENALKGIAQVRGEEVEVPSAILKKIAPLSFLDLLKTEISQDELNWYAAIYVAFDKVAAKIDYSKLK